MLPLTARQKDIYEYLLKTIREKGYAPSIPEIGAKFKIASTNGVSDHLKALEKKGTSDGWGKGPSRSYRPSVSQCYLPYVTFRFSEGSPLASRSSVKKTRKVS